MRKDGRTDRNDVMKLIVTFRSVAIAPKNSSNLTDYKTVFYKNRFKSLCSANCWEKFLENNNSEVVRISIKRSRDSSVDIVTGLRTGQPSNRGSALFWNITRRRAVVIPCHILGTNYRSHLQG
jgi:hypothetical protein